MVIRNFFKATYLKPVKALGLPTVCTVCFEPSIIGAIGRNKIENKPQGVRNECKNKKQKQKGNKNPRSVQFLAVLALAFTIAMFLPL